MKTNGKRKQQEGIQTDSALKQEGIRMDGALKARIHRYQQKLQKDGLDIGFSMAVRSLIKQALDAAKVP